MLSNELQTFLPMEVSDADTNGGAMSANQIISGVVQNVWDHVPKAERLAGSRKWRGLHDKVGNDDDETLINPGYYLDGDTLGEDWVFFFPAGYRETQIDWTVNNPPTRKYVSGTLLASITETDTVLTINLKDNEQAAHILDGDMLIVTDKTDPEQVAGNEVFRTVTGTPTISDKEVTVTLTAAIGFAFTATVTKAGVIFSPAYDIKCSIASFVATTAGDGTAVEANVLLDNIGTIKQIWTFTRTSATAFTVSGDTVGALAVGDSGTEYAPLNPDWAKPYMTVPTSVWVDTWAIGDTLVMETDPAAQPLVQERRVPVNCASLANNRIRKVTIGESAS